MTALLAPRPSPVVAIASSQQTPPRVQDRPIPLTNAIVSLTWPLGLRPADRLFARLKNVLPVRHGVTLGMMPADHDVRLERQDLLAEDLHDGAGLGQVA